MRDTLSAGAIHHIFAIDTLPGGRGNTYSQWKSGHCDAHPYTPIYNRAETQQGCKDRHATNQSQRLCTTICTLWKTRNKSRHKLQCEEWTDRGLDDRIRRTEKYQEIEKSNFSYRFNIQNIC